MFSRRSGRDLSPNAIARVALEVGKPRFDLSSSNPTSCGLSYPPEWLGALQRAQAESLSYRPDAFGWRPAREALSQLAGGSPDDIVLSASTSEAYSYLFKLLCDPGDAVLVPAPSYPLFEHLAELEGVQALAYRVAYDGAWHLDLDSVRRSITPRVRAIVLVSPNNPTGNYVRAEELTALAELGLPLVVDEVFAPFWLGKPLSGAPKPQDVLVFSLDGLSKRVGSPQLKLGWTVISGPQALRAQARARLELIADTFLSVATPIQRALPELLQIAPAIADGIGARCRENLTTLRAAIDGSPITLLEPEAGWSAPLHLPHVASEEDLVLGLLRDGVLVQPGYFYDFEREPYAIVSLLTEPRTFQQGAARLVQNITRVADG